MQRVQVEVDDLKAWIYQRPRKSGGLVWYVDVADPTGRKRYAVTRSLKTSSKTRAIDAAKRLLRSRQVLAADGGIEYLSDFWRPESSRRLRARKAAGTAPGDQHINTMRNHVENHVLPWLRAQGVDRLSQINYSIAQDLMTYISEKFKAGTVPSIKTAINQPLKQAVREELIPHNPLSQTELPRRPKVRREHIEWPKLQKILRPGLWTSRQAYAAALLSLSTGMRSGEIRALLWRYVDLDKGLVDVVHSWEKVSKRLKAPKNGQPRLGLRIPALVVEELRRLQPEDVEPDGFVFTGRSPDQPIVGNTLLRQLRAAAKRAGVTLTDRQTFHSLRHSAVSYGLAAGQDRARREALLQMAGHADEGIQSVYTHTTEAELDAIAKEWDERFSKIG
jgi:integrase